MCWQLKITECRHIDLLMNITPEFLSSDNGIETVLGIDIYLII